MRLRVPVLALLLGSSASCALVLGYGDFTEEAPTTSAAASSGSGGAGTSTASAGGAGPVCADGGTPSVEICGNDADEDCDGAACLHVADWSYRYRDVGAPALDRAITAVATVGAETAIAGWYNGTLDLGGANVLPSGPAGVRQLFVARLATDGSTKFLAPAAVPVLPREAVGVALNAAGTRVAATGFVETGTGSGRDLFVSYNAPSNQVWTKQIGGTGSDQGNAVAFDASNNVLVAGVISADAGGGNLACAQGDVTFDAAGPRMLVAQLAGSDGACLWGRTFAASPVLPRAILIDALGQVIVVGAYAGVIAGTPPVATAAGLSPFALALDASTGATVWIQAFPVTAAASSAAPTAVAAGSGGRLYLSGALHGTATLGGKPLSSTVPGEDDALVMALDGSAAGKGALVWAHRFGGMSGFKRATAIGAVPQAGGDDVFVAGLASGAMSVEPDGDTGALCPLGGVFLLKLSGEHPVWGDCFGTGGVDSVDVVRMANSGHRVVLAGARTLGIDFGKGPLTGTTFDAFAAQLSSP
jgi:hypothetical protein